MLVEIEGHTVPHFKALIYSKLELWGLKYGGTLSIQTDLLKISRLLHKMGFVQTEIATTVGRQYSPIMHAINALVKSLNHSI